MADIKGLLKKYYGYDSFRPQQEDIIEHILSGRDVFAIMPTGAGKSICYQIPALAMDGIALVISPLISLMQDQVRILKSVGVAAAYLNSSLTPQQISLAISRACQGMYKIIYVAPERLTDPRFVSFAMNTHISLIAVDEAHCISMWGQEFRPSYCHIADFTDKLPQRPKMAAFTATANARVKQDIAQKLRLVSPYMITASFDRPNLYFGAQELGEHDKFSFVKDYVSRHADDSGIIYCLTRYQTETVAERLKEKGFSAEAYHGGMPLEVRKRIQENFTFDRTKVIAATNAFGMGIDKPNVRYVLHYSMQGRIEDYYQQAGRAGRDGEMAECILLYSYTDYRIVRDCFIYRENDENDKKAAMLTDEERKALQLAEMKNLDRMWEYAASRNRCLRRGLLNYFGESLHRSCRNCSGCLQDIPVRRGMKQTTKSEVKVYDKELYGLLRARVRVLSLMSGTPAYAIASDTMLKELAAEKPRSISALRKISGFGEVKIRQYGNAIIEVVNVYEDGR